MMSCNNDIELFDEIIESPVVYGLLSSSDTSQYIRLERSFADPNTSAVNLAKDANAVYYENATVELIDPNEQRFTLQRVNAVDEGYVRKPGEFLTDPNYLYKIASDEINLQQGEVYSLEVIDETGVIARASTQVLDTSRVRVPVLSGGIRRINFTLSDKTNIRWVRVEGAINYAISFDVKVNERNLQAGTNTILDKRWNATGLVSDATGSTQSQNLELLGDEFFSFIASEFDENPNVERQLIQLDIRITSYGDEIGQYLDIINANSGITSAQEVPIFTNIENGYGLFSSTSETVATNLAVSDQTLDELYNGEITGNLSFTP